MSAIPLLRGTGTRAASIALLAATLAAVNSAAAGTNPPENDVVALAFSIADDALIKAGPHAVALSRNEGQDWQPLSLPAGVQHGHIASVAFAAKSSAVLYVAGAGFGVLRSADGGRSWTAMNDGLPSLDVGALASHADPADTVYAHLPGQGIFRSEDAGGHWRLMDAGPRDRILRLIHSNMPGSMQTGWLFAATAKGVGRSMDCFCGWRDAGSLGRAVTAVAYDPGAPEQVYAVTAEGLFVSATGGEQWSRAKLPSPSVTALAVGRRGTVYATGAGGELFRSTDHGNAWLRVDG